MPHMTEKAPSHDRTDGRRAVSTDARPPAVPRGLAWVGTLLDLREGNARRLGRGRHDAFAMGAHRVGDYLASIDADDVFIDDEFVILGTGSRSSSGVSLALVNPNAHDCDREGRGRRLDDRRTDALILTARGG